MPSSMASSLYVHGNRPRATSFNRTSTSCGFRSIGILYSRIANRECLRVIWKSNPTTIWSRISAALARSQSSSATASLPFTGYQSVAAVCPQTTVLEEIIVTATKRPEQPQDVPLSIMTVSGEAMTSNGIKNLHGIALHVPNLTITKDAYTFFRNGSVTLPWITDVQELVTAQLEMSPRTLQRRLADNHLTQSQLMYQTRQSISAVTTTRCAYQRDYA